jgi:hypothetical protein
MPALENSFVHSTVASSLGPRPQRPPLQPPANMPTPTAVTVTIVTAIVRVIVIPTVGANRPSPLDTHNFILSQNPEPPAHQQHNINSNNHNTIYVRHTPTQLLILVHT